jgi:exodeoxyribonuclease VII large subunit
MSLVISQIDPSILLGDIEKQKAETRKRLEHEGYMTLQKQLYFGPVNKRIALIGSPGTSGFEDFINELERNDIYRDFKVKVFPVGVQSQEAVQEIENAIYEANLYDVDAIAIVRGGGSKMDLHIFNSYTICTAVALSKLPVITGIGHESDACLIDEVAHTRMKTPTAAAKLFYMNIGVFSSNLSNTGKHIQLQVRELLSQSSGELQFYSGILYERVDEIVQMNDLSLNKQVVRIQYGFNNYLFEANEILNESLHNLQYIVFSGIQVEFSQLDAMIGLLERNIETLIHEIATKELKQAKDMLFIRAQFVLSSSYDYLDFCAQKLGLVDPNQLFKKGYTISTIEGKDINKIKGDLTQKEMTTHSSEYTVLSKVKEIIRKK